MTYHDNVSGNLSTNYNGLGKNGIFNGSGIPFREERASLSVFFNGGHHPMFKSRQDDLRKRNTATNPGGFRCHLQSSGCSTFNAKAAWTLGFDVLNFKIRFCCSWAVVSNSQQQWFLIMLHYR